jgi:hypothetical protein
MHVTENHSSGETELSGQNRGVWTAPQYRGLATGWGNDYLGFDPRQEARASLFSSPELETNSGVHSVLYPVGTESFCSADKAREARNWPLTSIYWRGWKYLELYLHSPYIIMLSSPLRTQTELTGYPWPTHCETVTDRWQCFETAHAQKFGQALRTAWNVLPDRSAIPLRPPALRPLSHKSVLYDIKLNGTSCGGHAGTQGKSQ